MKVSKFTMRLCIYVFVLNLLGVSFDRETVEEPTIRFGHQKTPRISQSGNQIQPSLTIPDAPWKKEYLPTFPLVHVAIFRRLICK